uniref:Uncharacterized protein n=1 Tax=Anguilla anguilla TaxID=7936 RepID=A0A0E9UIU0_ANGAN
MPDAKSAVRISFSSGDTDQSKNKLNCPNTKYIG